MVIWAGNRGSLPANGVFPWAIDDSKASDSVCRWADVESKTSVADFKSWNDVRQSDFMVFESDFGDSYPGIANAPPAIRPQTAGLSSHERDAQNDEARHRKTKEGTRGNEQPGIARRAVVSKASNHTGKSISITRFVGLRPVRKPGFMSRHRGTATYRCWMSI